MKKVAKNRKAVGNQTDQALRRLAQIKAMPTLQLVGEVLARAQLIEEIMRAYIVNGSAKYSDPRQVRGTFGSLRFQFNKIYPNEGTLLTSLESANDVRNDVAHNTFLINWFFEDLLKGVRKRDVNRFNHRSLEKMLHVMDDCVFQFRSFMKKVPLTIYDAKLSNWNR